jgi:hypothetical protein
MNKKRSLLGVKDALTKAKYRRGTRNSDSATRKNYDCAERTDHGLIQTMRWPKPDSLEAQEKYAQALLRRFVPKGGKR